MKNNHFLGSLLCLLFFSPLQASQIDSMVTLSPEPNYAFILETAVFPGGLEALNQHIAAEIAYPISAREEAIEGAVVVSFAIGSDGQVFDAAVKEGLGHGCDEEVIRVIRSLPRWYPARFGEEAICIRVRLAVNFNLEK